MEPPTEPSARARRPVVFVNDDNTTGSTDVEEEKEKVEVGDAQEPSPDVQGNEAKEGEEQQDDDEEPPEQEEEQEQEAQLSVPGIDEWHEGFDVNDMSIIRNCLCMNCHLSDGTTTMLPTKIPYFREIIVMHFECPNCYVRNSEVSFGGQIQEYGEQITITMTSPHDFNRQLIKSDSATVTIPKLQQFEIPAHTQRGCVSTMEGIFRTAATNLQSQQAQRLQCEDMDNFYRCQFVIKNLNHFVNAGNESTVNDSKSNDADAPDDEEDDDLITPIFPFDVILNDIAGNSYIENIMAPQSDPNMTTVRYNRTPQQDMMLGLQPSKQAIHDGIIDNDNPQHKNIANATHNRLYQSNSNTNNIATTATTTTDGLTKTHHDDNAATATTRTQPNMHFNDISRMVNGTLPSSTSTTTTTAGISTVPPMVGGKTTMMTTNMSTNVGRNEVMKFMTHCSNCYRETETDMCIVDIPHFKEVIIMSMVCDDCGYRSNEIKGGGGIPKYGCNIVLQCTTPDDLMREVLKSDTAGISIPEIDLELEEGGLDGLYTTIEGLIIKIRDRLESSNPFGTGDSNRKHHLTTDGGDYNSTEKPIYEKYQDFLHQLTLMSQGMLLPCTIILSDPLSNSFIGPIPRDAIALSMQAEQDGGDRTCYDNYIDPNMIIKEYTRTFEQNELLGLNDMKTENYSATTTAITKNTSTDTTPQDNNDKDNGNDTAVDAMNDNDDANNNNNNSSNDTNYYGTDQMEELPDRIRRIDVRGPDHPHLVGKAPVENDTTIMGPGSLNFAVPSIGQRNTTTKTTTATTTGSGDDVTSGSGSG